MSLCSSVASPPLCALDTDYRVVSRMRALSWHFKGTAWLCRKWVGVSCCEATVKVVASSTVKVHCAWRPRLPFSSPFLTLAFLLFVVPLCHLQLDFAYFMEDNEALYTHINTLLFVPLCIRRQWDLARAAMWPHHSWTLEVSGSTQRAQLDDDYSTVF